MRDFGGNRKLVAIEAFIRFQFSSRAGLSQLSGRAQMGTINAKSETAATKPAFPVPGKPPKTISLAIK
jgi:hypothetical protein